MQAKNLIGMRFGKLTVLKRVENTKSGKAQWLCQCDCGKSTVVPTYRLTMAETSSCGCKKHETKNRIHGMKGTRIYSIWCDIKKRCNNPNSKNYKNYGAKGITVCQEWCNDFVAFYEWSMKNGYSDRLTIDRINNKKGYSPDNCRWITFLEQQNNKLNNIVIDYNGESDTLPNWCRKYKKPYKRVYNRLSKGLSFEEAMIK